jgi:uncharacterized membrane protein YeaQ/YmgE (transglycosylase-associated protein family)
MVTDGPARRKRPVGGSASLTAGPRQTTVNGVKGMVGVAAALIVLLLLVSFSMMMTFGLLHLVGTIAIAGLVGWIADLLIPGELPFGWLGAVVAGVVGGWLGSLIIGNFGPALFGVHLIPALLGASILAVPASFLSKKSALGRR